MNVLGFVIWVLLLIVATRVNCSQEIRCARNQVYTTCSTPCRKNCSDPDGLNSHCKKPRCECVEGYVFYDGDCIPKEKCPPIHCPINRIYKNENIFYITCDRINVNPKRPGCYCAEGYVLNRHTNQCILPEGCPKELKCYKNEQEDYSINPCPATCLDPNPPICLPLVCQDGCACKKGFLRDTESGYCVKPEDCPDPCPRKHEVYNSCGTACEPACGYTPEICTAQCVSGCFCKKGYVRECTAKGSRCIPIEKCPNVKGNTCH